MLPVTKKFQRPQRIGLVSHFCNRMPPLSKHREQPFPTHRLPIDILRNGHVVAGQQVHALQASCVRDVRASSSERSRIAEQIGAVPANYGGWMLRPHRGAGLVDHDQSSVLAPGDAGTVQVRVRVVRDEDTLALAARHNEVGARSEGTAAGDEHATCVSTPSLARIGDAELRVLLSFKNMRS